MDISVIIPLYNKADYIARAIEVVIKQSYPASEIIVINDGSTDDSYEVVATLAKDNASIRLYTQKNQGASYSRNRGVELAKSSFVAFLDADDEWKPDYLFHIQRLINNFPDCGAYATSYDVLEEDGTKSLPSAKGIPPTPWIGIIPNLFRMMQIGSPFNTSSIVITKTVFQDLNGFPVGVNRGEDKILWIHLGMKYPIAYSPSRQVVYHKEANNRASNVFDYEFEAIRLLDSMIRNQEIPLGLFKDVIDYNAYLKIELASAMIIEGRVEPVKVLLTSIRENLRYRKKWLWWYFWSKIPHPLTRLVYRYLK